MQPINLDDHVTEHFLWREMLTSQTAIRLGINNMPTSDDIRKNIIRVCETLEMVRAHLGQPIHVTSCYRSPEANKAVGGSITSAHMFGLAADHTVKGMPNKDVCRDLSMFLLDFDQIIYEFGESGWVHLGLSSGPGRKQLLSAVRVGGRTLYMPGLIES